MRSRLGAALLALFSFGYGYLAFDLDTPTTAAAGLTAASLPLFYAACGLVLSAALFVSNRAGDTPANGAPDVAWRRILYFLAAMSTYAVLVRPLGFVPTTAAFLFFGALLMRERRHLLNLGVALPSATLFWLLLDRGLGVYIPAVPEFASIAP